MKKSASILLKCAYIIATLPLTVALMNCSDPQIRPQLKESPCKLGLVFSMDSITRIGEGKAIVWGHIKYDSILIINQMYLQQWEYIDEIYNWWGPKTDYMIQAEPDTIDFRLLDKTAMPPCPTHTEWIYSYTIELSNLKEETPYFIHLTIRFTEKDQQREGTITSDRF